MILCDLALKMTMILLSILEVVGEIRYLRERVTPTIEAHKNISNPNIQMLQHSDDCTGPPYIYITLHDAQNIYKYSRNGCLLDENVLETVEFVDRDYVELRSMAIGKYNNKEALYVTDATSGRSRVMIYDECDNHGKRSFITTALTTDNNPGVDHTYGICFDADENLYVSNQHTDNVMRFYKDSFKPMALPLALEYDTKRYYYYKGTYKQFGSPNLHDTSEQGVRSIAIIENEIWIANEDFDGLVISNLQTGVSSNIVIIPKPIGLYYDPKTDYVFVSSKGKHRQGAVFAVNRSTMRIEREYKEERMEHPTGIFVHNNVLYVAEQIESAILTFDIQSMKFLGKIIKHIPGDIEHMILSDC